MRKPTETLVQTTWLADDPLFACHDNVTDVKWDAIEANLYDGVYTQAQQTLISVFAYLAGNDQLDSVSLSDVGELSELERLAILDALRIHWAGIQLQEDL